MPGDVHKITLQLRAPRASDPGKVAIGYYMVVEGSVVLTDEAGKPLGGEKHQLAPGEDARLIACRMLRKRRSSGRPGGFDAKLSYPKLRY